MNPTKLSVYDASTTRRFSSHGRILVHELLKGRREASSEVIRECLEKDGQYAPLFRYKLEENGKVADGDNDEYNNHNSNALHLLVGSDYPKSFILPVLLQILEKCPSAANAKNAEGNFVNLPSSSQ